MAAATAATAAATTAAERALVCAWIAEYACARVWDLEHGGTDWQRVVEGAVACGRWLRPHRLLPSLFASSSAAAFSTSRAAADHYRC